MWGFPSLETVGQDLRYGVRLLRRSPAFTVVAVLSLAIGIGSTAAVFSLADALVLRKLPVVAPDELAVFRWQAGPRNPAGSITGNFSGDRTATSSTSFSFPAFDAFRQDAAAVAQVFGFANLYGSLDLTVDGHPEVGSGQVVSGDYFSTLGIRAAAGRLLLDTDDRSDAPPAAVISYGFWTGRFGRAPNVVGKTLVVNRVPVTIVGVTPKGFHHRFQVGDSPDVTLPMAVRAAIESRAQWRDPSYWWVLVMARLRPGVSPDAVQALLDQTLKRTAAEANPLVTPMPRLDVLPGGRERTNRGGSRESLVIMASVVGVVLLVACATVANLLLVRGVSRFSARSRCASRSARRARESGTAARDRRTPARPLRQRARLTGRRFHRRRAAARLEQCRVRLIQHPNRLARLPLHDRGRRDVQRAVRPGAVSTHHRRQRRLWPAGAPAGHDGRARGVRLTSGLVIVQVALSILLVTVAGLLVYSIRNLQRVDPGFDPSKTLIFRIDPVHAGYDLRERARFSNRSRPG